MDLEEERLIIEDARYNPLSFGKLYDRYYTQILNYLLHRLPRADIAQDLTSEVFYKAMTKLKTFSWRNISFSSWLFKIANNEVKMYYRRKERRFFSLEFLFESQHIEFPHSTNTEQDYLAAEDELSRNKKFKEVQKYLLSMSPIYQEVLVLRFFEDKSMKEISEITGKKLNTVKSLILRGKENLKSQMLKRSGGEK